MQRGIPSALALHFCGPQYAEGQSKCEPGGYSRGQVEPMAVLHVAVRKPQQAAERSKHGEFTENSGKIRQHAHGEEGCCCQYAEAEPVCCRGVVHQAQTGSALPGMVLDNFSSTQLRYGGGQLRRAMLFSLAIGRDGEENNGGS